MARAPLPPPRLRPIAQTSATVVFCYHPSPLMKTHSLAPAFRAQFLAQTAWAGDEQPAPGSPELTVRMGAPSSGQGSFCRPLLLPQLDLATLPGGNEPPLSESILKRNKLSLYEKQCSKVAEGLYVSGEWVARSRGALRDAGITHVVNCVGALYPEFFKSDGVAYRTLWLQGAAGV